MIYYIGYFLFKVLSAIFFPLTVLGREHLALKTGFVIASNHVSNLDPFILGIASQRRLSYMTKDALFRNKILSYLLYRVDAFPIRRGATDFQAIRETLRRLKRGTPVVLFPEGTRQGVSVKKKVHPGIGFIVVKAGVPVIPAYIKDSQKVMAPGRRTLRRSRVTVVFGAPLYFTQSQSYLDIAREVMHKISLLGPAL